MEKPYEWTDGAALEDHLRRKHKILREYFFNYLTLRCSLPQQERFRLAIIDGFAGGGRYSCGTAGSPIIFIEELKNATEAEALLQQGRYRNVLFNLDQCGHSHVDRITLTDIMHT